MDVTVCTNAAGMVWVEDSRGTILGECFFKTDEETQDEPQRMGYRHLLTVYPTAQIAVDTDMSADDLGALFLEG